MRVMRVAWASTRKDRNKARKKIRGRITNAPENNRDELRGLNVFYLLERASTYRPAAKREIVSLTKFTLRMLARWAITLGEEISEIDAILEPLVIETRTAKVVTGRAGSGFGSAPLKASRGRRALGNGPCGGCVAANANLLRGIVTEHLFEEC